MTMTATMITAAPAPTGDVPAVVLETLLRNHLADHRATLLTYTTMPFAHEGTNDSTTFYRVTLHWMRHARALDVETATWILKSSIDQIMTILNQSLIQVEQEFDLR